MPALPSAAWERAKGALENIPEALHQKIDHFNAMVDAELIVPFQKYIFYPIITIMTAYLAFGAVAPPQAVEENLSGFYYDAWLVLGLAFPPLSILGRHFYERAAKAEEGNSAYGGAYTMLFGDFGVWSSIVVYVVCTIDTFWWGQGLWAVGFVLMGIPACAIFTYRSARRVIQIRRRETRLA